MFDYQHNNRFFAQIAEEIKELCVEELSKLKAQNISPVYRGIYFNADKRTLYAVNYHSRYLTRILAPLLTFHCHDTRYLYKKAKGVNWDDLFSVDHSFAIFATVTHSRITHSQYAARRLKDAVVDHFIESCGKRPRIDTIKPDVWLNLHIDHNLATISLDTAEYLQACFALTSDLSPCPILTTPSGRMSSAKQIKQSGPLLGE
jgi:putative N6-adenine-specific DNA methylase